MSAHASSSNSLYSDAVSDDNEIEDGTIPLSQSQASIASLVGRLGHLSVEQEQALSKFKEALKAKQQEEAISFVNHNTSESQSPENKATPVCYYSEMSTESATIDSTTTKDQADYSYSLYSDANLLRFLRARKFVVDDALKMWIAFIHWRTEFNAESLFVSFEFPEYEKVKEIYPRFYHKTDRIGRPVYFEKLGSLDATKLFQETTEERLFRHHVFEYEKLLQYRLPACSIKSGQNLDQYVVVVDLNGVYLSSFYSYSHIVSKVASVAQSYYPELLAKMFIINAPYLFSTVWTIVKQFLDEVTANKIHIISSDYKDELLKVIHEDNLPQFVGGKCCCEKGCDKSDTGPWNDGTVAGYPKKEFERL